MAIPDSKKCELPSEKYYNDFERGKITKKYHSFCDSNENTSKGENILSKYAILKNYCYEQASNLKNLTEEKVMPTNLKKRCTYPQYRLHNKFINTVDSKFILIYIMLLYSVWLNIKEYLDASIQDKCNAKFPTLGIDYFIKWKKIHDYNSNKVKYLFQKNEDYMENCNEICMEKRREDYCKYIIDIFNIYKEFEHVCNTEMNNQRCPEFWDELKNNYSINSEIELMCKEVHDKLGFYKIMVPLGGEGEEKYIEQYESEHIFSFFEKLIGYSIKYYLSKTIHYSKYIVLPIILILLFYSFMKKLSLFGSNINLHVDMRKMWRNVQGVTNPETLHNPRKLPSAGNKMN
ncbi:PIR protein [Plasmodium ovale]|uniref:PIR Superfamily Protein n=2 Tax=Plasmodium ovale TaxID=36330 RepID=A0A1A8WFE5_PLAOA|nr:PIR Superfamily Protein [Plasmodium ovale curtisi]SBT00954.1 PIR Superfamily Protein [Plasmodium ovale curtisi]SBT85074.1 PIR protein [Plasmodium ovale]